MTPDEYEDITYELNRELGQAEQREIARRVERALTSDEGDDVSDRLSEIEARLAGATPGVWKLWGMDVLADQDGTSDVDTAVPVATTRMLIDGKPRTFDAELIAHAPTDLTALVKFAREVEALHQPRTVYANESHCALQGDHAMGRHVEDRTGFWVCLDSPLTNECQTCTDENGATADWPCPTAAALQRMGGAS